MRSCLAVDTRHRWRLQAPDPVRPEHPEYLEVTVPAGTTLQLRLETPVASDRSHVEEEVHARLHRAVVVEGKDCCAEGSAVSGTVAHVERSAASKAAANRAAFQHPRGRPATV